MCDKNVATVKYQEPPPLKSPVRWIGLDNDGNVVDRKDAVFFAMAEEDKPIHAGSCGDATCIECGGKPRLYAI